MNSVIDTVMAHLDEPQVEQIAGQLGTSPDQARLAIEHALPLMVGGMAQNASTPQGAQELHNALGDHAGQSLTDVLSSVLGGGAAPGIGGTPASGMGDAPASGLGGGILSHIFGDKQSAANQGLGHVTGLGQNGAGALMAMLAPMIMAALANHVQRGGMNSGQLGGMLGQHSQDIQQQGGVMGGLLSAVLGSGGGNLDLSSLMRSAGSMFGSGMPR
jgi:hypothetical protein